MVTEAVRTIQTCRVCGVKGLAFLIDMGMHYLTNYVSDPDAPAMKAPLRLGRCKGCGLVQLIDYIDPELLYKGTLTAGYYWYRSSMNRTMREHLSALAGEIEKRASLSPLDVVVDIGCNDGYMLSQFKTLGIVKVGYEPGPNLVVEAQKHGIIVFPWLFDAAPYRKLLHKSARVISAIAMFYDVNNPLVFCNHLSAILSDTPEALAVIEMNDLYSIVKNNAFDIIGHEHVCYYSLATLQRVLQGSNLEVYDVERFSINGGVLRVWIVRKGRKEIQPSVERYLHIEREVITDENLNTLSRRIVTVGTRIYGIVREEVEKGGRVYIYGASTRGNTILQVCGLGSQLIKGAAEIHPDKIGKYIAGLNIPIVTEEEARKDATAFLVMPYSYKAEFLERERDFIAKGGKLIFPLPDCEVVG